MTRFNLETEETVEELKMKFKRFLLDDNIQTNHATELEELQQRFAKSPSRSHSIHDLTSSSLTSTTMETQAKLMDTILKWSVRFDGQENPLTFLERVEELAEVYHVPLDSLPRVMPMLFDSKALDWYRNNKRDWVRWNSFKSDVSAFFLPPQYYSRIEDQIRTRHQNPGEPFKDYMLALQNLMRQVGYEQTKQLERLYMNAAPEYQLHIKRKEFKTLGELIDLATNFERLRQLIHQPQPVNLSHVDRKPAAARLEADILNPSQACRRCGLQGHYYRGCRNERVLYCWECGKRNVFTKHCCRRSTSSLDSFPYTSSPNETEVPTAQNMLFQDDTLLVKVKIEGTRRLAMLDTGATNSLIDETLIRTTDIGKQGILKELCHKVNLADGQTQEIESTFECMVTYENRERPISFIVMPKSLDHFVLGVDLLREFGTTIQCGRSSITLESNPVRVGVCRVLNPPVKQIGALENSNTNSRMFLDTNVTSQKARIVSSRGVTLRLLEGTPGIPNVKNTDPTDLPLIKSKRKT